MTFVERAVTLKFLGQATSKPPMDDNLWDTIAAMDWDVFQTEESSNEIYEIINEAMKLFCKPKEVDETKINDEILGINKDGWYDDQCRSMKRRLDSMRQYLKRIKKFPLKNGRKPICSREDHSKLFNKYKKLIRSKKAKYKEKWLDSIDNSKKLGQYNNKLKATGIPNGDIPLFEHPNGEQMTPEETIEKVSCDLFPGCINEDEYKPKGEARKLEA